ncbi:predicted protein [Nematostella vectensis]|uniref:Uncharacterized protein n=1 Tax=Nematostella vectensis TaxID=45351 RepID=A7SZB6_NEMVE|nr:predicted protein [Nematostella vectensis]|eukprot:XP_001623053.1 predicted protein [Nematostella vectensis]
MSTKRRQRPPNVAQQQPSQTISEALKDLRDEKMNREVAELGTAVVRELLKRSSDQTVSLPCRGKSLVLKHTPNSQKPNDEVSARHLRRRVSHLQKVGGRLSAGGERDIHHLRQKEKNEGEVVLKKALGKELILQIPEGEALAMKADLRLPWFALGKLRRDKNVVLFAFGDYEYICRMLGISGASGRYPCVWCLIHNQDMRKPPEERDPIQPRTPEHMEEQLQNFLNEGNGDLKKAKDYFNVIHEPLLDIPSDRICVPGLHISIGLFLKFYNLFMTECESLDILIAKHKAKTSGKPTGDTDFDQYVKTLHSAERHREKARKLREQAKQAQEHITFKITNDGLQCDEEYVHPYLTGLEKLANATGKIHHELQALHRTHSQTKPATNRLKAIIQDHYVIVAPAGTLFLRRKAMKLDRIKGRYHCNIFV